MAQATMLATLSLLGRMIGGAEDGIAGKVRRAVASTAPSSGAAHSGTVAVIERRPAAGSAAGHACKRVLPQCERRVRSDVAAVRAIAWSVGCWNEPLAAALQRVALDVEAEVDMAAERERAAIVAGALRHPRYTALDVHPMVPVPGRCTSRVFVYEYAPGAPLAPGHGADVLRRYALAFFWLLHADGIVLMDPSPQNAIVGPERDGVHPLTLIDAGACRALSAGERRAARALHCSRGEPGALRTALGGPGVSNAVVDSIAAFSAPFWDSGVRFPDFGEAFHRLAGPALLSEPLDPDVAPVARAVLVMARTIAQLGHDRIDVAAAMRDIEAYYALHGEADGGDEICGA